MGIWKCGSFKSTDINQLFCHTRRNRDSCVSILNLYSLRNVFRAQIGRIPGTGHRRSWETGNTQRHHQEGESLSGHLFFLLGWKEAADTNRSGGAAAGAGLDEAAWLVEVGRVGAVIACFGILY